MTDEENTKKMTVDYLIGDALVETTPEKEMTAALKEYASKIAAADED